MKAINLILALLVCGLSFSQKRSPQADLMNYVPGELIIKLKDEASTGVTYKSASKGIKTSIVSKNIGDLIGLSSKIDSYEALFSEETVDLSIQLLAKNKLNKQIKKNTASKSSKYIAQGPDYNYSLKNVFKVKFKDPSENINLVIEQLKENKLVDYAEPNYIFSVNDFTIDSDIIYDKDLKPVNEDDLAPLTPNDPLYSDQSNITDANIDDVWGEYTTGDGSQIVAILDTGVDYTHPDLVDNIWENIAERDGIAGFDDDGNGYVDDIYGWDFINADNTPLDDNMHGTHVAGIVGAVGGNGKGIAGAAWNVKLMSIKVFQSNGTGNSTTIAEGVTYSAINGATILNMSFGSYAESQTLKSALENAYASSVLVGAAGNNKICIGPGKCPDNKPSAPLYPGAYTYVLGVEDSAGGYDNYDLDGPIFSRYDNFLNYELKANGSGIISTIPNGGYRKLTGTSMATPLVAGAIALYNQEKPDDSTELLFGNLINTSSGSIDLKAAIEVVPTPILKVLGATVRDTINSQNGNGFFEPGETLEIFPTIKNYWGLSDQVYIGVELGEFVESGYASINTGVQTIGSIDAYGNLQNIEKPLKITLGEGLNHGVAVEFKLKVWTEKDGIIENLDTLEYFITSTNAIILDGYVESDLHLTEGKEYIFTQNLVIAGSSTLTIDPGVTLRLTDDIVIDTDAKIIANGTKDKFIEFIPAPNKASWGGIKVTSTDTINKSSIKFSKFYNSNGGIMPPRLIKSVIVEDVLFYDAYFSRGSNLFAAIDAKGINIIDSYVEAPLYKPGNEGASYTKMMYNQSSTGYLFANIKVFDLWHSNNSYGYLEQDSDPPNSSFLNFYCEVSSISNNLHPTLATPNSVGSFDFPSKSYFGVGTVNGLKKITSDYYTSSNTRLGKFNFDTAKLSPSVDPHAHVWKVLVNGKDAQDEYDSMDALGVGEHNFTVYFNREMDTLTKPNISYGVREPYNQKLISETGSWANDGKSYSVTHKIGIGAADGINRIRVQDAKDLDNFYIPVEDYRFNFSLQSAGSASAGFAATPGLGEITLEWDSPTETDLNDVLGYNMYRYTINEDGTEADAVKINSTLIPDVNYKDYNVERDTQYYYKYKVLRTSFEETDYSKSVSTKLLTASLGDSNGDNAVDVLDVVNTVDYILGNNPTPYIDYATDVNSDSAINVLDIVGIVDLILNPSVSSARLNGEPINYYPRQSSSKATFYWDKNDLYLVNEESVGGIQLAFDDSFKYSLNKELSGFETLRYKQDKEEMLVVFALNETELKPGKHKILTREKSNDNLGILKGVISSKKGTPIDIDYYDIPLEIIKSPVQKESMRIISYAPNPTNGPVDLYYYLPETVRKVIVDVYDFSGNLMYQTDDLNNTSGYSHKALNLGSLKSGMYVLLLRAESSSATKYMKSIKIIKQ